MAASHTVSIPANALTWQDFIALIIDWRDHVGCEVTVPRETLVFTVLNCCCFIDSTAFAKHPQLSSFAIDCKGAAAAVAIDELIHITSLLCQTDFAKRHNVVVFASRWRRSLSGQLLLLS